MKLQRLALALLCAMMAGSMHALAENDAYKPDGVVTV
jgi:hypothetical protein